MSTSVMKVEKIWVVGWSEDDDGWIQPGGKSYHKTEDEMKKFIEEMRLSPEGVGMMPISRNLEVVKSIPAYNKVLEPFYDIKLKPD